MTFIPKWLFSFQNAALVLFLVANSGPASAESERPPFLGNHKQPNIIKKDMDIKAGQSAVLVNPEIPAGKNINTDGVVVIHGAATGDGGMTGTGSGHGMATSGPRVFNDVMIIGELKGPLSITGTITGDGPVKVAGGLQISGGVTTPDETIPLTGIVDLFDQGRRLRFEGGNTGSGQYYIDVCDADGSNCGSRELHLQADGGGVSIGGGALIDLYDEVDFTFTCDTNTQGTTRSAPGNATRNGNKVTVCKGVYGGGHPESNGGGVLSCNGIPADFRPLGDRHFASINVYNAANVTAAVRINDVGAMGLFKAIDYSDPSSGQTLGLAQPGCFSYNISNP